MKNLSLPKLSGLTSALNTAKSYITAKSPTLLTGAAIAGVVTTGVLSAKAGYKARMIIEAVDNERQLNAEPPTSLQEKAQLTWLCYAAPAVTGVSTIASVAGVHLIHTKRNAALAGLYAMASTKLDDYQERAEELLGTKKTQQINNEMAQREVDRHPIGNSEVIVVDDGTELCFDEFSGRYFRSSVNKIEEAVNNTNALMNSTTLASADLNDFYGYLGLPRIGLGDKCGWSGDHMDVVFGSTTTSDGRPAISFSFRRAPEVGHDKKFR